MPKLIDYPRTSYTGAWELCEVIDDTGGKCAIETAARKLDRKVSGSFKAIIGSAVKFNLLTSKRELLSTTTLFKRIKHAYDKQEELLFHREAFLSPPLFTQICRKFRSRELPVQMLDVMLIREFGVEEINAQGVAKAFVDGCRMVGLLDERNIMAAIDTANNRQLLRRELSNPTPPANIYRPEASESIDMTEVPIAPPALFTVEQKALPENHIMVRPAGEVITLRAESHAKIHKPTTKSTDAIATLFGLATKPDETDALNQTTETDFDNLIQETYLSEPLESEMQRPIIQAVTNVSTTEYQIQVSGPGINTKLSITEEDDIAIAVALLEKIRRQLKNH